MTASTPALALLRPNTRVRQAMIVVGGAAFTALCAQIRIPLEPVPVTMQTLGVMLTGLALGGRLGLFSQLLYLSAGISGLPVLASISSGPAALAGPTGGYLVGFAVAGWMLGFLAERGWDRSVWKLAIAAIAASTVILLLGFLWLTRYMPAGSAFQAGVLPFLAGDAFKCAIVVLLVPPISRSLATMP
ncbi:biotin transporter BioY [Fimbriimonas ginsengisoli]|uniref:Biotin transporter n=1 Tax=Fimbriimonas ginsengisoli Gsoil 348 TaxID=661478 RepID=A0A068NW70_FIMGI|nr:biotin transporter BioY [Fimbriimonas ginsengisoli]AIE87582.1 Substrate-specific component BioY of biotin ECF transporter [Fimbriimonas ginsengisoli Gsoil 348]